MSARRTVQVVAIGSALWLSAGVARAQSAPTCSFDSSSATATITVDGMLATISRTALGAIRVNNVVCGDATVNNTDTILVNGGALADPVTINGTFEPGLTPELDGASEVEVVISLAAGTDNFRINFTDDPDLVTFASGGIDVGNDGDEDVTTAGTDVVRVYTLDGDDIVNASSYTGGGTLSLWGGTGIDSIEGSDQNDRLYGQTGNDSLLGRAGNDRLTGGPGDDIESGGDGADTFLQGAVADGNDTLDGGLGIDRVDYGRRIAAITVTVGNGLADDGEEGVELDNVDLTTENVTSGSGNDTLVGSTAANTLVAGIGDDQLFGASGRDILVGGRGTDIMAGDGGPDELYGDAGPDTMDGGPGNDAIFGGPSNDTLTGGGGSDSIFGEAGNDLVFNDDGVADSVDCGTGPQDDAEPDAADTIISCEI